MKISRQFYQIYSELENIKFDGINKTINTLRAKVLNTLSPNNFREYIPNRKDGYEYFEDIIRVATPEAEIKFGVSRYDKIYLQTSVSNKDVLENLHQKVLNAMLDFFKEDQEGM